MRLFFAIPIPADIGKKMLAAFHVKQYPNIRFILPEQLHITLHFLGTTAPEKLAEIKSLATGIAASVSRFNMQFVAFTTVIKQRKPVMIRAQLQENAAFETLSRSFQKTFPTAENRKPTPHITIARIKQLKQLPFALPQLPPCSFVAERIELYESFTLPDGASYTLIESWEIACINHSRDCGYTMQGIN